MLPNAPVAAHDSSKLNEALLVAAVEADRLAMRAAELNRIPLSAQLFYRADQPASRPSALTCTRALLPQSRRSSQRNGRSNSHVQSSLLPPL